MSFFRKTDPKIVKKVELATSELLTEPNWGLNMELTDEANRTDKGGKGIISCCKKRLSNKNKKVVYYTLELVSSLVNNGNHSLLTFIDKQLVSEVAKTYYRHHKEAGFGMQLLDNDRPEDVAKKSKTLISDWYQAFCRDRRYPNFSKVYAQMEKKGVRFVADKKNAAPVRLAEPTPEQLQEIVEKSEREAAEARRIANMPPWEKNGIPFEKFYNDKLLGDLKHLVSNSGLARDIVEASTNVEELKSNDILPQVMGDIREGHQRLLTLLMEMENPLVMDLLLQVNEFVHNLVENYDLAMRLQAPTFCKLGMEETLGLIDKCGEALEEERNPRPQEKADDPDRSPSPAPSPAADPEPPKQKDVEDLLNFDQVKLEPVVKEKEEEVMGLDDIFNQKREPKPAEPATDIFSQPAAASPVDQPTNPTTDPFTQPSKPLMDPFSQPVHPPADPFSQPAAAPVDIFAQVKEDKSEEPIGFNFISEPAEPKRDPFTNSQQHGGFGFVDPFAAPAQQPAQSSGFGTSDPFAAPATQPQGGFGFIQPIQSQESAPQSAGLDIFNQPAPSQPATDPFSAQSENPLANPFSTNPPQTSDPLDMFGANAQAESPANPFDSPKVPTFDSAGTPENFGFVNTAPVSTKVDVPIKDMSSHEIFVVKLEPEQTMSDVKVEIGRVKGVDASRITLVHVRGRLKDEELVSAVNATQTNTLKCIISKVK